MDKLDKITRIKISVLVLYLFTFFTPIYSQRLFGTTYKVSISGLGAGVFFVAFFLILVIGTIVTHFLKKQYYKYIYLTMAGFMTLFLFVLLVFKDSASTLRLTWYFHVVLIAIVFLSYFMEELTVKIFDTIGITLKDWTKRLLAFTKEKAKQFKEKRTKNQEEPIKEEEGETI